VKNRFQSLPFKCNLQRYNKVVPAFKDKVDDIKNLLPVINAVGLCRLNQVDP
jgi:hypothetical protein